LVEEAAEANVNVLRIWGGGRFKLDALQWVVKAVTSRRAE
jgi:hypothetical protein